MSYKMKHHNTIFVILVTTLSSFYKGILKGVIKYKRLKMVNKEVEYAFVYTRHRLFEYSINMREK